MYVIIEMQTDANGNTAMTPPITKADRNEAESVFHQILAAAALSGLPKHAAVILDEMGNKIDSECYQNSMSMAAMEEAFPE